jgi:hypothetical protein
VVDKKINIYGMAKWDLVVHVSENVRLVILLPKHPDAAALGDY